MGAMAAMRGRTATARERAERCNARAEPLFRDRHWSIRDARRSEPKRVFHAIGTAQRLHCRCSSRDTRAIELVSNTTRLSDYRDLVRCFVRDLAPYDLGSGRVQT